MSSSKIKYVRCASSCFKVSREKFISAISASVIHRCFFNNRDCAVKFMTGVFFLIYFRMRGRLF